MPDTISGRDFTIYRASDTRQSFQVALNVAVEFEAEGQKHAGTVLECDAQGAKIATEFKPSVGTVIRVGRMSGRVAAHFQTAIAVEFFDIDG